MKIVQKLIYAVFARRPSIFIVGIPNFGIVYFKRIFKLRGQKFRFIGTLNWKRVCETVLTHPFTKNTPQNQESSYD